MLLLLLAAAAAHLIVGRIGFSFGDEDHHSLSRVLSFFPLNEVVPSCE